MRSAGDPTGATVLDPATPPGPLFWTVLLLVPGVMAFSAGVYAKSAIVMAHSYVLACFSLTSVQAIRHEWWRDHVEGELGMPSFVHRAAGIAELMAVALRLHSLWTGQAWSLVAATVMTFGTNHCVRQISPMP